jgi:hypothetical protein
MRKKSRKGSQETKEKKSTRCIEASTALSSAFSSMRLDRRGTMSAVRLNHAFTDLRPSTLHSTLNR